MEFKHRPGLPFPWILFTFSGFIFLGLVVPAVSMKMSPVFPPMCKSHPKNYKINTALVTVNFSQNFDKHLVVYTQSKECYKCDLLSVAQVEHICTFRVDSRWPTRIEIRLIKDGIISKPTSTCSDSSLTALYEEGSTYTIYVQYEASNITCMPVLMNDPPDPYLAIYVAIAVFLCLIILWNVGGYIHRRGYFHKIFCFWSADNMMSDLGTPTNVNQLDDSSLEDRNKLATKDRLKSLDTFRGISIVLMIFVNYGGGKYWFFKHSKWNGLTFADLVFPWFIFIMGTAIVFSFQSQLRRSISKWKIFLRIIKRSIILFTLGLVINSSGGSDGVDLDTFRIPGVLQRFAGTYLITASVFLFTAQPHNPQQFGRWISFRDITCYWQEWILQLALVALQLTLTFAMPVPGCPRGYLGPGGLEQGGAYFNCTGGASGYIDRKVFGDAHIYSHPTSTEIYKQSLPYDPEGLLGTLNSCFLCFLGLQAGKIIFIHSDWVKRCRRFFIWSLILAGIGTLLCKASLNDGWIPINKNLWSLSFILILGGMAFFLLLICYLLIDVYKFWSGMPFNYAGMNAIALYCGHEFFSGRFPVDFVVSNTHGAQLALNLWGTSFWVLVSIYFYYKDVFITI